MLSPILIYPTIARLLEAVNNNYCRISIILLLTEMTIRAMVILSEGNEAAEKNEGIQHGG